MPRLPAIDPATATGKAKTLLDGIAATLGFAPNLMRTLANAPAALQGYLDLSKALSGTGLSPAMREAIALAVAGENGCQYCASAHTLLGGKAGASADELARNLTGQSADPRVAAALAFALRVVAARGRVSDAELADVRAAGFDDRAITEIVALVAVNVLTNYVNNVARTDIDFPVVPLPRLAA